MIIISYTIQEKILVSLYHRSTLSYLFCFIFFTKIDGEFNLLKDISTMENMYISQNTIHTYHVTYDKTTNVLISDAFNEKMFAE